VVGEGDFLRAVAEAVLQLLMESDVAALIGAAHYVRSGASGPPGATVPGSQPRYPLRFTAARTPELRQGRYLPPFLEARKSSDKALIAVIQGAWIGGVSNPAGRRSGAGDGAVRGSASRRSPSFARRSTSGSMRFSAGRWSARGRISGSTPLTSSTARAAALSVVAMIAVAASTDGRREEAKTFWSTFLKSLRAARREVGDL
jgi:putative transposase